MGIWTSVFGAAFAFSLCGTTTATTSPLETPPAPATHIASEAHVTSEGLFQGAEVVAEESLDAKSPVRDGDEVDAVEGAEIAAEASSGTTEGGSEEKTAQNVPQRAVVSVASGLFFDVRFPDPTPLQLSLPDQPLNLSWPYECARKALVAAKGNDGGGAAALKCIGDVEPLNPRERYLLGLALIRSSNPKKAAPLLDALAKEHPSLADQCRWLAGKAFASVGQEEQALSNFLAITPESNLRDDAVLAAAATAQRLGRLDEALNLLEPIATRPFETWGRDVPAEALFAKGKILEAKGEGRLAAKAFIDLWSYHPRSPLASKALEGAQALKVSPNFEAKVRHADALANAQRSAAALETVQPLLKSIPKSAPAELVCLARSVAGRSLRKLRRHREAVKMLTPVMDSCSPGKSWAASMYTLGMAATGIDNELAQKAYLRLARSMPDSDLADDALFLAAGIAERDGDLERARRLLRRVVLLHETGDHRAEALFRLAWISRKSGHLKDAHHAFGQLAREYLDVDPEASIRAAYWKARVLEDMGNNDASKVALEKVVERHPTDFYALLARTRLGEMAAKEAKQAKAAPSSEGNQIVDSGTPSQTDQSQISQASTASTATSAKSQPGLSTRMLTKDPLFLGGLELISLGFTEEGVEELLKINRTKLRHPLPPDDLMALSVVLARNGQERLAHVISRNDLKGLFAGVPRENHLSAWKVSWPELYRDLIEKHASEVSLDPDLLQALVREESAFKPTAGSWAGAIGLCQLMMPTAREVAGWLNIKGSITKERLYSPDLNLRMGATYLSRLIRQFKGDVALAVAAYNAGAGSVRRFLARYPGDELDEFVEEIPFEETRHYVKRVLGSMATYQLIYGRSMNPTLSFGTKIRR